MIQCTSKTFAVTYPHAVYISKWNVESLETDASPRGFSPIGDRADWIAGPTINPSNCAKERYPSFPALSSTVVVFAMYIRQGAKLALTKEKDKSFYINWMPFNTKFLRKISITI